MGPARTPDLAAPARLAVKHQVGARERPIVGLDWPERAADRREDARQRADDCWTGRPGLLGQATAR
jgi:hypothetical protein